jgi:hypothetical protein
VLVSAHYFAAEEIIAGIVGKEATTGCVVGWGDTMHERGVVEMTSGGGLPSKSAYHPLR